MNEEAYRLALQEAYCDSLYHTCTSLFGFKDVTTRTHRGIITALEDENTRKLICVPRGTLKSTICSVAYPIWRLMKNPNLRILLDSELYTNSKNLLREIKGLTQTQKFIDYFGDWKTEVWNESEIIIKPRNKVLKEASITVGGIGTTKVGQHYDEIIGDDYNSPSNSNSKEQRDQVISHFQYNQAILEPGGRYIVVGTRYAEEDLIGWIISNQLNQKSLEEFRNLPKTNGVIEIETKGFIGG